MNAAVTLQQRLAIQTMQKVEAQDRARLITKENAGDIFALLTQVYMNAADGAHLASEIYLGNGEGGDNEKIMQILGYIKSNLIFIGAVIDGKK